MKTCQACGKANADEMRFCLDCGAALPDAPIVFDLGSQSGASQPGQFGAPGSFGNQGYQQQQPFSMVPPSRPKKSYTKIFVIVGGLFALFALVIVVVAGIIFFNAMKEQTTVVQSTPTPQSKPSESPTSKPSTPKKASEVSTPRTDETDSGRATAGDLKADFNVKKGGKTGMRIYTTFTVYNMKGQDLYLALYFLDENGDPLKTPNKKFASTSGDVALFYEITPGFDEAYYEKVELFMPYEELRLKKGNYNLKVSANVIYKGGGILDYLEELPFEYEQF